MDEIAIYTKAVPDASDESLNQLLEKLYLHSNLDFREYKASSIARRVDRRLRATKSASYQDYIDFLDRHPEEYEYLVSDLTINVTEFFRDNEPWDFLRDTIFPNILSEKLSKNGDNKTFRVWSAGCSTGQEAYSIAILLTELAQKLDADVNIEIYGTDIDTDCLSVAQKGQYEPKLFDGINTSLISKCIDETSHIVNPLKQHVYFQRHDLVLDPPLMDMDCIICRNVAIYFSRNLQRKLFNNFHQSLREGGYLFLGKAESLFGDIAEKFTPVNTKWKIYQK